MPQARQPPPRAGAGGKRRGQPYRTEHYERWHALLRDLLHRIPGPADSDFTAHAPLAATRADLVAYLAGEKGVSRAEMRAQLAGFTAAVLDARTRRGPAAGDRPSRPAGLQ